jgi:hypothetical protein
LIFYNIDSISSDCIKGWAASNSSHLKTWLIVPQLSTKLRLPPPSAPSMDVETHIIQAHSFDCALIGYPFRRCRFRYIISAYINLAEPVYCYLSFEESGCPNSIDTPLFLAENQYSAKSIPPILIFLEHAIKAAGTTLVPKILSTETISSSAYYPQEVNWPLFENSAFEFSLPTGVAHIHTGHFHYNEYSATLQQILSQDRNTNVEILRGSLLRDPFSLLRSRLNWLLKHGSTSIRLYKTEFPDNLELIEEVSFGSLSLPGSCYAFRNISHIIQAISDSPDNYGLLGMVDFYIEVESQTIYSREKSFLDVLLPIFGPILNECGNERQNVSEPNSSKPFIDLLRSKGAGSILELYKHHYDYIKSRWYSALT